MSVCVSIYMCITIWFEDSASKFCIPFCNSFILIQVMSGCHFYIHMHKIDLAMNTFSGDQELVKLRGISHLVTTVKPEVILGLMLLKNLHVFFSPPPPKKKTTHTPYFIHTMTFILIYMLGLCLMRLVHECWGFFPASIMHSFFLFFLLQLNFLFFLIVKHESAIIWFYMPWFFFRSAIQLCVTLFYIALLIFSRLKAFFFCVAWFLGLFHL